MDVGHRKTNVIVHPDGVMLSNEGGVETDCHRAQDA